MASARVMRAIRISEFGGPEVLKYVTDALVPTPKPNEVRFVTQMLTHLNRMSDEVLSQKQLALKCDVCARPQVLVRVRATGINPVETYLRAGQYSSLPSLPFTPGSDVAGTVDEVGSAVSRFKVRATHRSCRSSAHHYSVAQGVCA